MKIPYLNVYAQPFWHQQAFIVGNKEALLALRDAIDSAIAEDGGKAEVCSNDNEGYNLHVYREESDEYWDKALFPYTDKETCCFNEDGRTSPWDLFKKRKV